jgi:hypothetical protein
MITLLDPGLIVKLAATAGLVVVATLIAEKVGAFIGAMIAALPLSAGPAYLFIAMEHNSTFVAQSALTGLGINAMITPFLLIAAILVRRFGIWVGLGTGFSLWAAGSFAILQASLDVESAIALNVVAFSICLYFSRPYLEAGAVTGVKGGLMDVSFRTVAVVAVAATVIITGRLIGPEVAGFVAVIPIVWMSMAAVLYARAGRRTTSAVLTNGIGGMFGFCLALSAIHLMSEQYGSTIALSGALVICVCWNLGLTVARPFIPMYSRTFRRPI